MTNQIFRRNHKYILVFLMINFSLAMSCKQTNLDKYDTDSVFYFNDNTPNKIDTLKRFVVGSWQLKAWLYTENNKDFYCVPEIYDSVKDLSEIFNISIDTSITENINHYLDTTKWKIDTDFNNLIVERMNNYYTNGSLREVRFFEGGEQMVLLHNKKDLTPLVRSLGNYKLRFNGDIYDQIISTGGIDTIDLFASNKINMFGNDCLLVSTLFETISLKDYNISSEHFIRFYKRKK